MAAIAQGERVRLHKPARKQGRDTQLERIALAYARACAR